FGVGSRFLIGSMDAVAATSGSANSAAMPAPRLNCPTCQRLTADLEGGRRAADGQAQPGRAVAREHQLHDEGHLLHAEIRQWKQKRFGTSSETRPGPDTAATTPTTPKRS